MGWDIEPRFANDRHVFRLTGEFYDLDAAGVLKRLNRLLETCVRGGREMALDFRGVTRVNVGLATLLLTWAAETLAKLPNPCKLVLLNVNPALRHAFTADPSRYGHCYAVQYTATGEPATDEQEQ